ncbi:pleckstrin homology domain-containing family G member 6 [Arapaima gigas]
MDRVRERRRHMKLSLAVVLFLVTPEHLFSNMASVLSAHRLFWSEVMLPMLEEVRKTGSPFDPVRLEKGCMQFQERFSTYFQYCWEEERIVEFARRLMDVNPQFRTYITWVENHPSCGRMRLGDMQAKPHQRITKYPLLLAAVLKYTQDHKSQYAVRKMLSNVSSFLDSINAYMKFKDQELALSLIAQRVEGYEVMEAINEEVEKHVRDFCRFDLTSPIPGGGPRDIRKLLLEETLRIRERRESKVEVVVLLFSDVLLLTKAQRKSEKLKVVRPPLALDRLTCAALKDDCSFVLVEVGGLGCAVNVYVVVAPSSESRAQWIDSIQVTQASLKAMREREQVQRLGGFLQSHMQMETQAIPPSEEILNILGTNTEEPSDPSESAQVPSSDVQEGTGSTQSDNEKLASREMEGTNLYQGKQEKWDLQYMDKSFLFSQPAHEDFKSTRKLLKKLHGFNYLEMSELEAAEDSESSQQEKREIVFNHINERKVTWNNSRSTYPDLSKLLTPKTDSTKSHSSSNTSLMFDMESDLESSCSQSEYRDLLYDRNQGSESESFTRESKRDSGISQSEDDALREMWRFTRKLKSPRLRRRRLLAQHGLLPQAHNKSSLDAAISAPSSSSGFSSEDKQMPGWNLFSSDQRGDAWAVDDLGSVKQSQGIARCSSAQGDSPATQTFPPAELLIRENGQSSQKMPRLKSQRSLSVPDIERQEAQGVSMSPTWSDSNISFYSQTKMVPKLQNSALEEILKRATAREQDKQKRVGKLECKKWTVLDPVSSPSLTASLPLYPSDAGQERPRKVPDRRQERQGDANRGLKYSLFLGDGTSVDWEGWCFDDNEVMFFLDPDGGRGSADTNGTLTSVTLSDFHEDQQSSEV